MLNKRIIFPLLCIWIIVASCSASSVLGLEPDEQPRTYYDTLELSTPEIAVETFSDAFARDDFLTVYLVLSTRSQFIFLQRLRMLDYSHILQPDSFERIRDDVSTFAEGIGAGEHTDEGWYIFDQIMLAAKKHDVLLIDLSGEVSILESRDMELDNYDQVVDVICDVDGIQGRVTFRMVQAPSGNWRVYQVIVPGGDEDMVPWAVPQGDS
ncbi:MAG TPA: hypothetical protein G4O08_05430 [Anaerolineae bacterium]|nr:hypothetical protein [Anaerolineae bacterium]